MANTINLTVAAQVRDAVKGIADVNGNLGKLQKTAGSGVGVMKGMLATEAITAGASAVVGELKSVWDGLQENKAIAAQTSAVLKSTGGAAHITAAGVAALGDSLEQKSTFDAEAIRSGENLLLTFTNIKNQAGKGNDVFNQTTQIMTDMATAMGTDPKAQAIQLGKALNDPVKGISALSRVGVSFTKQQSDQVAAMVKTGNTMGAQKLILGELNKEFGGSASKAADTFTGKLHGIKANLEGALEDQMVKVLPYLSQFADWAAAKIPPALTLLGSGVQTVADKLSPFAGVLKTVGGFMRDNPTTVKTFATVLGILAGAVGIVTLAQWAWNVAMTANPIGAIIVGIAALVAAGVYLWMHTTQLRARLVADWHALTGTIAGGVMSAVHWVGQLPGRAWSAVNGFSGRMRTAAIDGFNRFNDGVRGGILTALRWIGGLPARAYGAVAPMAGRLWSAGTGALARLGNAIKWGIDTVVHFYAALPGRAWSALGSLGGRLWSAGSSAMGRLAGAVSSGATRSVQNVAQLPGRLLSAVHVDLSGAGSAIMSSLYHGLLSQWETVKGFVGGIAGWIKDHKGPLSLDRRLLTPAGAAIMGSLIGSLRAGMPALGGALADITSQITGLNGTTVSAGAITLGLAGAAAGATYYVTIDVHADATTDKASLGRELARALDAYFRTVGRPGWAGR